MRKNIFYILLIIILIIGCEDDLNENAEYIPRGFYFTGQINNNYIEINDEYPNHIISGFRYYKYHDTIFWDIAIGFDFNIEDTANRSSHDEDFLEIHFVKKILKSELDSVIGLDMGYIYKDFKNYFSTGIKAVHASYINENKSDETIMIQYNKDVRNYYVINDNSYFDIESLSHNNGKYPNNKTWEELVIEGRFEATLIHREFDLVDSIRLSNCLFKGRLLQIFYKDSIYGP